MGSFGMQEMVVVAVVALLVLGPERLPEFARSAAKLIARFRAEASGALDELKAAADIQDLESELKAIRGELRGVSNEVSSTMKGVSLAGGGAAGRPAVRTSAPPFDPDTT